MQNQLDKVIEALRAKIGQLEVDLIISAVNFQILQEEKEELRKKVEEYESNSD